MGNITQYLVFKSLLKQRKKQVGRKFKKKTAQVNTDTLAKLDFLLLSSALQGGGYQRLRAHLYGSLLYYLQIAQKPEEPDTLQTGKTQTLIQRGSTHWQQWKWEKYGVHFDEFQVSSLMFCNVFVWGKRR